MRGEPCAAAVMYSSMGSSGPPSRPRQKKERKVSVVLRSTEGGQVYVVCCCVSAAAGRVTAAVTWFESFTFVKLSMCITSCHIQLANMAHLQHSGALTSLALSDTGEHAFTASRDFNVKRCTALSAAVGHTWVMHVFADIHPKVVAYQGTVALGSYPFACWLSTTTGGVLEGQN